MKAMVHLRPGRTRESSGAVAAALRAQVVKTMPVGRSPWQMADAGWPAWLGSLRSCRVAECSRSTLRSEAAMVAREITLRFDLFLGAFDDSPARDLAKDRGVNRIQDHFFTNHDLPYSAVVIAYAEGPVMPRAERADHPKQSKSSEWRSALLSDGGPQLFNALRKWRAERAKREGVPANVICTNAKLAKMASTRP